VSAAAAVVFDWAPSRDRIRAVEVCAASWTVYIFQQSGAHDSELKAISRRSQRAATNPRITVGSASSRVILGEYLSDSFEFIPAS
jgi:hypothetical protein